MADGGRDVEEGYGKAPRQRHHAPSGPIRGSRPMPYDPARDRMGHPERGPHGGDRREEGMGEEHMQLYDAPPNSLKVSAVTDVRELCAAIIRACHANNLPALLTIGNQSVNQAVKGIAAASAELAQLAAAAAAPYDPLTFQPAFRHANRTKPLIAFYLSRYRHVTQRLDTGEESELTATANQKIVPLAGAVANKVREHKRVRLLSIGADAVTNAVLGIGNARLFLEGDRLDIKVVPEFVKINKSGTEMSAIRFNIIPERI